MVVDKATLFLDKGNANNGRNPPFCPVFALVTPSPSIELYQ